MSIFDLFKKGKHDKNKSEEDLNAPGWDAITAACEQVYPTQKNPKHYGTLISRELGGNNPLDGISIYDGGDFWHFVTYGLTELYDKTSEDETESGYGMEFTLKLKKAGLADEEAEIKCICGVLQAIARITFNKGEVFMPYEYLYTGQTQGIDSKQKSNITGFITVPDKELKEIDTPNGKVVFVEFVGATDAELVELKEKRTDVKSLYEKIGSDVTDYHRESVV